MGFGVNEKMRGADDVDVGSDWLVGDDIGDGRFDHRDWVVGGAPVESSNTQKAGDLAKES